MSGMISRTILSRIIHYLVPYKFGICLVLLSLTTIVCVTLSLGSALQMLIDQGIKAQDPEILDAAIMRIIFLILTLGFASFVRSYFINGISEKVTMDIRRHVYSHLLTLKYQEFEKLKASDITSRFSSDMDLVSSLIIDTFSYCIRNSMIFVGGLIMMFTESIKLSCIVLLLVPLVILSLLTLSTKVKTLSKRTQSGLASLFEQISETFYGIQTIYASNAQDFKKLEFAKNTKEFLELALERLRFRSMFFALAITGIMCSVTFVIWLGSLDVVNGTMSPGGLVSFIFYAAYSAISIGGMAEIFGEMQRSLSGLERVFAMLEIRNVEAQELRYHAHMPDMNGVITFQNTSFAYPSRPDVEVLHNLSLNIKKGEFVAIVGPSGAGKSTIAQLLLGFFETNSGEIDVLGGNIKTIGPRGVRKMIAYVAQNPFMFAGSIRSNLTLSDAKAQEIEWATKISGLDILETELQKGLDTYIGAYGAQISGGERQRIAIARAILCNPEILLLDEATSALDQTSERLVMQGIRDIMKDKTIISIAHRISSIEQADRILVMDQGRIIAEGTHAKLLQECGLYQKLCNTAS
jgi:ATP-binding cassette subfamily B protein